MATWFEIEVPERSLSQKAQLEVSASHLGRIFCFFFPPGARVFLSLIHFLEPDLFFDIPNDVAYWAPVFCLDIHKYPHEIY